MESPTLAPSLSITSSTSMINPWSFLEAHPTIQYFRFQWLDLSGILRVRIVTKKHAEDTLSKNKLLRGSPISAYTLIDGTLLIKSDFVVGADWYFPDWDSLKLMEANGRYAVVMCSVMESHVSKPVASLKLDSRRALVGVLKRAEEMGLSFLVGFEVEFMVMKIDDEGELVFASQGMGMYAAAGLRDKSFHYVEECVQELGELGIEVQGFHTEGRRGQYEIALGPLPPLQAIDTLVLTHSTIKRIFAKHNLIATMFPNPYPASFPSTEPSQLNGQHTHLSITPAIHQDYFLAGILANLPALTALSMPYEASYARVKPRCGGGIVAWGTENRGVPIRKVAAGHWEIRNVDATANMYLALAGIISTGLSGIGNQEALRWEDTSLPSSSSSAYENETAENGAVQRGNQDVGEQEEKAEVKRLPATLQDALKELENGHESWGKLVGDALLEHYVYLKTEEMEILRKMDEEKRRKLFAEMF